MTQVVLNCSIDTRLLLSLTPIKSPSSCLTLYHYQRQQLQNNYNNFSFSFYSFSFFYYYYYTLLLLQFPGSDVHATLNANRFCYYLLIYLLTTTATLYHYRGYVHSGYFFTVHVTAERGYKPYII